MASLKMLDAAAAQAGFVHADCVHEAARTHLVYDYPEQRVSLVNAIDFMQRVARQNPK